MSKIDINNKYQAWAYFKYFGISSKKPIYKKEKKKNLMWNKDYGTALSNLVLLFFSL